MEKTYHVYIAIYIYILYDVKKMKYIYNIFFVNIINKMTQNDKFISSSVNDIIGNKIKSNKIIKQTYYNDVNNDDTNDLDMLSDEIELEKLEKELEIKSHGFINHPKNYGNFWTEDERTLILNYLKKNKYINNSNLYDETQIQKIAKKTERSEAGVKEEIKKMIFNDYIGEFYSLTQLSTKYNIPEHNIKILIKLYLEKYGKKILYPIEIENKILKSQVENIKLKKELKELLNKI